MLKHISSATFIVIDEHGLIVIFYLSCMA